MQRKRWLTILDCVLRRLVVKSENRGGKAAGRYGRGELVHLHSMR